MHILTLIVVLLLFVIAIFIGSVMHQKRHDHVATISLPTVPEKHDDVPEELVGQPVIAPPDINNTGTNVGLEDEGVWPVLAQQRQEIAWNPAVFTHDEAFVPPSVIADE